MEMYIQPLQPAIIKIYTQTGQYLNKILGIWKPYNELVRWYLKACELVVHI